MVSGWPSCYNLLRFKSDPEGEDITSQQVWKKFLYKTRHEGLNSRKSIFGGFLGHSVFEEKRKKEGRIP